MSSAFFHQPVEVRFHSVQILRFNDAEVVRQNL